MLRALNFTHQNHGYSGDHSKVDPRDLHLAKVSTQRNLAMGVALVLVLFVSYSFVLHGTMLGDKGDYRPRTRENRRMGRPGARRQHYRPVQKRTSEINSVYSSSVAHTTNHTPKSKHTRWHGVPGRNLSSGIRHETRGGMQQRGQTCDLSAAAQAKCSHTAPYSLDCLALVDNNMHTRWSSLHRPAKASVSPMFEMNCPVYATKQYHLPHAVCMIHFRTKRLNNYFTAKFLSPRITT